MSLPRIYNYQNKRAQQDRFGGLNHTYGASSGELWDMQNLSSRHYPLLAPRKPRYVTRAAIANPHGIFWAGALFEVIGTTLYVDGVSKGTLSSSEKTFCALGERVLIFPDKKIYENGELKSLEASYTQAGLSFHDGEYAGEAAEANSVTTAGAAFPFRVGDAVTISGCTVEEKNNRTPIIREISDDGKTLRFYENTFTLPEGSNSITESGNVTIARNVPELDFVCTNENRVWGCKGDSIFASKLGDPYNWYVFDDVSTSSFSVESGTAGDFTGCVSFLGYPVFFKEDRIFKMYGTIPSNFQLMSSAVLGVADGSAKSLAIAGETLFYLSKAGVMAYSGGVPRVISMPLGEGMHFKNAVGGSDGLKYYVSMQEKSLYTLYCYDTANGLWHKEDDLQVVQMTYDGGLYAQTSTGTVMLGDPTQVPQSAVTEESVQSTAEFAPFDYGVFEKKHLIRVKVRAEVEAGGKLILWLKYDSGAWEQTDMIFATERNVFTSACPIRRCDSVRMKITGTGDYRIYSVGQEYASGGRK